MGLAAAVIGAIAARSSYERNPQFPLMYAPPEGIGPAQAKYIFTESIDQEAYVATLMYAADKGAIDLQKNGEAWTITDKQGAQGWAGLDEVTVGVAHLLGGPGTHVRGRAQGRVGRRAAEDRDRVVRHATSRTGRAGRATWSAPGSAASAACWCSPP